MLSVALASLGTSALLSSISRFEKVRCPSTRYICWQRVPLKPSRALSERCERDARLLRIEEMRADIARRQVAQIKLLRGFAGAHAALSRVWEMHEPQLVQAARKG